MILAVIPARGGSKRIKNKNIKKFYKKPIISYSIEQAKKSEIFDRIIVSTDSTKIAKIAKKSGAEILFRRPKKLSGDKVMAREVIKHSIKWVDKNANKTSFVCMIYPTAPMIKSKDLVSTFKKIKKEKWDFVFTAKKFTYPVQRSFYKNKNNSLRMANAKYYNKRSQDLKPVYHDAGQFYWAKSKTWLSNKIIFGNKSTIHLIDNLSGHDIDTQEDWQLLKALYKLKK